MLTCCRVVPVPQAIWFANHPSACRLAPWLSWLKRLFSNRRSWVRIPAVPLEGELEHHLGLSVFFLSENGMQTGVQRSASAAGDLVANHPSAAARECWIQNGIRERNANGGQSSTSAAGDLVCKPPLSCCQRMRDPAGRRGLVGQSACLVNRRSWDPLLFELHSNCAETQGPCPSYPPSTQPHADGLAQGKNFCGALWGNG